LELPPIRIGLTVSKSGKYQTPSSMIHRAFQIWEQDTNNRGGLLGREVQLVVYDDQSNEKLVRHLYEQLIVTDKVDLVFSPYGTPLTLAASEVTERHKFVMLACGASGEENWSRGYRHLFGVYAPASRYFIGFLDIMARHGLMSVAILYEQSSFNISAAQGAREWAARFGIKVALFRGYKQGASDLPQIIPEVIKENPDGLILCAYPDDGYLLLELLRNAPHRPKALGMAITPTFPEFVVRAKDMAEGVFAPSQWEATVRMPFPGTKEFLEKFMAAKGEIPQYHATAAFATAEVLSKAVTATGSLDHGKIRDYIQNLDTVTVIGRFKVDHTGLQIGHNPILIQWQKGKKEIVYPTSMRTAPPLFDLPGKGNVHENPQKN
ncbi:MAG: amino acid ABC transporter substrate-binding protein, partial [Desulfobaccales bacterium]